jgi:hypothetical protein
MDNQVTQTGSGNHKTEKGHPNADPQSLQVYQPRGWLLPLAVTGGVVGIGGAGFWWLLWASRAFDSVTDALTFLTGGTFTLALLLVALVQACVYWSQRGIMRQQWQAMQEGLAETRKAMRYGQSAYITVQGIEITQFVVGQPIEVTVIFTNSGITPAYDVNFYSRGGPRSDPFTFSASDIVNDAFQHGVFSQGILAPHGGTTKQIFGSRFPLDEQGIELIRTKPYHAWGVVFYQDIFKRDRWTQFCYRWRPDIRVFEICADCNKTDDQEEN